MAAGAAAVMRPAAWAQKPDPKWAKTWDAALATLAANVRLAPNFDQPVLYEGTTMYRGTWQECGPHESLAYLQLAEFVKQVRASLHRLKWRRTHTAHFFPCSERMVNYLRA